MRKLTWLFLVFVLLIVTGTLPAQTPNSVGDGTGDAGGGPDLLSASVTVVPPVGEVYPPGADIQLQLSVRFVPGTFNPLTTIVQFLLDTDQNPLTGSPGVNSICLDDNTLMGTDYFVEMGSPTSCRLGSAHIYKSTGGCNAFKNLGSVYSVIVADGGDGMDVMIPLRLIGHPAGLNFKVTTFSVLTACTVFTGVQDYMPDLGLSPGTLTGIPPVPPVALPLNPNGGTNIYEFANNLYNFKVVDYPGYSGNLVNMILQPILISQPDLDARLGEGSFAGAMIVPYDGTGGAGVLFQATCEDASTHSPADCPSNPGTYDVKTSWNPTGQILTTPAFLKAEIGTQDWENIFTTFYEDRIDPTGSGRTCCKYSEFVFVDGVNGAPPTITITTPQEGAVYAINQTVAANYTCTGATGQVKDCLGPVPSGSSIYTSSPGAKTFQVNATVFYGQSAVATAHYKVAYNTNGCLLYDPNRSVKSGATYPIKLQVCDAAGHNLSAPNISLNATAVIKLDNSPDGALEDSGNANPDNNFRFDASLGVGGGYIFNLSTKGKTSGTYKLQFMITGDPVPHSTLFNVK